MLSTQHVSGSSQPPHAKPVLFIHYTVHYQNTPLPLDTWVQLSSPVAASPRELLSGLTMPDIGQIYIVCHIKITLVFFLSTKDICGASKKYYQKGQS